MPSTTFFRPRKPDPDVLDDDELGLAQADIYDKAKRQWDERYGQALDTARTWRSFAILGIIGTLGFGAAAVFFAKRIQYIPYIVPVDSKTGRVLEATILEPSSDAREAFSAPRVITAQLRDFVQDWRGISTDIWAIKSASDHVYKMIDPADPADSWITNWYRETDPVARAKKERVAANVTSIIPMSLNTYEVVWTEDATPLSAGETTHTKWRAQITVKLAPPHARETVLANPSGIYVASISEPQRDAI